MKTFQKRDIEVVFKLKSGAFGNEADEVRISGLRVMANIRRFASSYSNANIQIFGLSNDVIKRILTLRIRRESNIVDANTVILRYTDETVHTLYQGGIVSALVDYNLIPNAPLVIDSFSTVGAQMTFPNGKSFPGTVKVATIMSVLAGLAGKTLINAGVDSTLDDETVNGSVQDMIDKVARDANIVVYDQNNQIVIAPHGQARKDLPPIPVSVETGLVGAPIPTDTGVSFTHLYSPQFSGLRWIDLKFPDMPFSEGRYYISAIDDLLDSEAPNGRWYSQVSAIWVPGKQG